MTLNVGDTSPWRKDTQRNVAECLLRIGNNEFVGFINGTDSLSCNDIYFLSVSACRSLNSIFRWWWRWGERPNDYNKLAPTCCSIRVIPTFQRTTKEQKRQNSPQAFNIPIRNERAAEKSHSKPRATYLSHFLWQFSATHFIILVRSADEWQKNNVGVVVAAFGVYYF